LAQAWPWSITERLMLAESCEEAFRSMIKKNYKQDVTDWELCKLNFTPHQQPDNPVVLYLLGRGTAKSSKKSGRKILH